MMDAGIANLFDLRVIKIKNWLSKKKKSLTKITDTDTHANPNSNFFCHQDQLNTGLILFIYNPFHTQIHNYYVLAILCSSTHSAKHQPTTTCCFWPLNLSYCFPVTLTFPINSRRAEKFFGRHCWRPGESWIRKQKESMEWSLRCLTTLPKG